MTWVLVGLVLVEHPLHHHHCHHSPSILIANLAEVCALPVLFSFLNVLHKET